MALTRAQIQTAFQNSLGRAASTSEENSYFSVSQSGALSDASIYTTISNSQEANLISDPVVRFYQAVFGRVPDQAGLDNTQDYIRANGASAATYQALATQFAQSTEFTNRFGTGTTVDAGYVQALYTTILGRQASAAEINGYTSGSNGFTTRGQVLYAISQSQEAIGISDAAVNGFLNNAAQGTAVYTGTLYTPANGQPGGGLSGDTFALTTALDNIVGTSGNDTIVGTVAAVAANSTFTLGDSINGGAGTSDRLTVFADAKLPAATVSNVEQIFIQNSVDLSGAGNTINANNFTGATQFWAQSPGNNIAFDNLTVSQTAGIKGTAAAGATIAFNYSNVAGGADTASLALDNASLSGGSTVTIAGIETLNVSGNGTVVGLTTADTKTINVAATGTTSLTLATNNTNLTKIDASASTAGVTFDLTSQLAANNVATTFTGGAGNDTLKIVAANLTAADTINGGGGTDTVSIGGGDYRAAASDTLKGINALQSIEQLEFTGGTAAQVNGDTFTNSAITKLIFNTSGATNDVIELAGARQYAIGADNGTAGDLTISQRAGATTLNLSLEGAAAGAGGTAEVNNVTSNGATTINLSSSGVAGVATNLIDGTLSVGSNATINVTGSQDLKIDGTTIQGAPGLAGAGANYNAGSFTGKLTLVGSTSIDTITVGSGGSSIEGGSGADIVTAGSGADTFVFNGAAAQNTSGAVFGQADVINGFTVGTDKLQFTNVAEVASGQQAAVQSAVTALAAGSTDAQIATAMATANTTSTAVSSATFNGNTYVLYETTGASTGVAVDDVFIKLAGVSSGFSATDITA